jgi:MYXO-CTERM domain-containing protein
MLRGPSIILLVAMGVSSPATGYVRTTTQVGEPISWPDACVPFHLHQAGSADVSFGKVLAAFRNALEAWEQVACGGATLDYQGVTDVSWTGFRKDAPNVNVVVFREDPSEWVFAPSAFAVTTVTYCENLSGGCTYLGQIRDTDIEVNGAFWEFTADLAGAPPRVDLENTLAHEVGHALGLAHSPTEGATMLKDAAPGDTSKRSLHADDIAGVCDIYPRDDAATCAPYPVEGDYFAPAREADAGAAGGASPGDGGCSVSPRSVSPLWLLLLATFARRRRQG